MTVVVCQNGSSHWLFYTIAACSFPLPFTSLHMHRPGQVFELRCMCSSEKRVKGEQRHAGKGGGFQQNKLKEELTEDVED